MSLQLTIRFEGNDPDNGYESNLLSHAFDLLESLAEEAGALNFLAVPWTTNEEDIDEEIEDDLGEEPEGLEAYEEYERQLEAERGRRGEFFPVEDLVNAAEAWLAFFDARGDETFQLDARRNTLASDLVLDLRDVLDALALAPKSRARFVIG